MSLTISDALEDGLGRLRDRTLVVPFLVLYGAFVTIMVGTYSQLEAQSDDVLEEMFEIAPQLAETLPETFPLALDVPLGVAWLIWFVGLLAFVAVSTGTFRVLVDGGQSSPETDATSDSNSSSSPTSAPSPSSESGAKTESAPVSDSEFGSHSESTTRTHTHTHTRSLLAATAHALLAAIVGTLAVGTGLALFVVPGLVLATLFAFTHPYIATDRVNAVEAMKRSLELTRGNRLQVFGVLAVIVCSFYAISLVGAISLELLASAPVVAELVNIGFTALAWLVVLAILASAFEQLETARTREDEKWEGIDDELLP